MSLQETEETIEIQESDDLPLEEPRGLAELLESLDKQSVLPSLPEVTEEKEIQSDKNLKLDRYILKFKTRIDAWKASHPEQIPPPIRWDSDYKDWVWESRDMRRTR